MNGEQLEHLADLALAYDVAREEEARAKTQKERHRDAILGLLKEAGERIADAGLYRCEVLVQSRQSIPVSLAQATLTQSVFHDLVQTSNAVVLRVTRL